MENKNLVSANKAHRKGLWQVRVWPMTVVMLVFGGSIYATYQMGFPIVWSLLNIVVISLICFVWSLRMIGTWKQWMVVNTTNPKTAMEMAKASFLKHSWKENMAIWGKAAKQQFQVDFDNRMEMVRKEYLEDAKERYSHKRPVIVHNRFSGLMWMLLFELIVLTGLVLLFLSLEDNMMRVILGIVFVIGLGGVVYTIKTIWKRNQTIIEISLHGITILGKHYGWIELENVDIVRGDTLIYQKHKGPEQELKLKNLSLSADYLDELILFYRSSKASISE